MKQVTSILKMFFFALLLIGGTACTSNFADINRKDYEVDKNELGRENYNLGATLRGLQGLVVPVKEHLYQFIEALAAGPYAGYFGATNPWTTKFETYNPSVDWQDKTFSDVFTETYPLYRDLRDQSDDPVALALSKLLRVAIMHRMTDMYGPIPYSKIVDEQGGISLSVPYDSQADVYKQMLKELDEVDVVLKENLNLGTEAFRKFDDVYYGDMNKWHKYTNSLKLRMAIRMSYVDPATAQQVAEAAVSAGVITSNADNAWLTVEENRASMIFNGWNDHRVGADIISYMNGYNDPRRPKMFTTVKLDERVGGQNVKVDGYAGIRIGIDVANKDEVKDRYSKPVIATESPYLWMNAAEITFLRAEGALRGWSMGGNAKDLYEEGIRISINNELKYKKAYVNGTVDISEQDIENYINGTTTQIDFVDPIDSKNSYKAMNTVPVKWNDGASNEEKLQRIITQKWLANFPLSTEAWAEYRRTGYPKLFPVRVNSSNGTIDTDEQIRRLIYSEIEINTNNAELQKGIDLLNQENSSGKFTGDIGGTRVWWDKANVGNF